MKASLASPHYAERNPATLARSAQQSLDGRLIGRIDPLEAGNAVEVPVGAAGLR